MSGVRSKGLKDVSQEIRDKAEKNMQDAIHSLHLASGEIERIIGSGELDMEFVSIRNLLRLLAKRVKGSE